MIENKSSMNNSIAFNPVIDDLTYRGYMALAYTVCGVKDCNGQWRPISLGKARQIFGLNEREIDSEIVKNKIVREESKYSKRNSVNQFKYINIRLIDTETGEVKLFANTEEVAKYFNVKSNFNSYIRKKWLYRNKYKMEADINPHYSQGSKASKRVKVTNVNTNEVTIYDSVKIASEKIGLNITTIYIYIKDSIATTKTGLKFEYLIED